MCNDVQVRFVTELAWQHHFVTNVRFSNFALNALLTYIQMFIRPKTREEIENFTPDFTVRLVTV